MQKLLASVLLSALMGCSYFLYCATCFPAGTMIQSPLGERAIEELAIGDQVWSLNLETGEHELQSVLETYIHQEHDGLVHIVLDTGNEIRLTPDHPLYQPDLERWSRADKLRPGAMLLLQEGETGRIATVATEELHEPVYNIRVSGPGTYYADGFLARYY